MSNFLIILGLMLFFFCFLGFITALVVYLPKAEKEGEKWLVYPFIIMGLMLATGITSYHFGMSMKKEQPMQISTKCGKVIAYKYYKNCSGKAQTRCNPFERIQIKPNDSEYSRLMRFEPHLARQKINAQVCFDFYDRFKYSHLSDSRIIHWVESAT